MKSNEIMNILKCFALMLALAALSPCFATAATGTNVDVAATAGEVSVSPDGVKWTDLEPGDHARLYNGNMVKTGKGGEAIVKWERGHAVKVFELSIFKISKSSMTGNTENISIELNKGKSFINVQKLQTSKSTFDVKTPVAVAGVRGTGIMAGVDESGKTTFVMQSGSIIIHTDSGDYVLDKSLGATLDKGSEPDSFEASKETMDYLNDIADELYELTTSAAEKSPLDIQDVVKDIMDEKDQIETDIPVQTTPDLPPVPPGN